MRKALTMAMLASAVLVSACNTVSGMGKDVSSAGKTVSNAAEDVKN